MMYDPYGGPNKRPRPDEYPGMAVDPHAQAAPVGYGAPPVAGYHPGYDERAAAAANAAYYGGAAAAAWGRGYQRIFTCVRLRGLPFQATETDVIDFLGVEPVDVLMCRTGGRPSGEAFVVLGTYAEFEVAMHRDKTNMGARYIEVFRSSKMDYYSAVCAEVMETRGAARRYDYNSVTRAAYPGAPGGAPGGGGPGGPMGGPPGGPGMGGGGGGAAGAPGGPMVATAVLKLRGLPFEATANEVADWFNADSSLGIPQVAPEKVHLPYERGRPSGVAFIDFSSPEAANAARAKHRQMMGSRYVEIFPSDASEMSKHM